MPLLKISVIIIHCVRLANSHHNGKIALRIANTKLTLGNYKFVAEVAEGGGATILRLLHLVQHL